jgi:hypothetical protein
MVGIIRVKNLTANTKDLISACFFIMKGIYQNDRDNWKDLQKMRSELLADINKLDKSEDLGTQLVVLRQLLEYSDTQEIRFGKEVRKGIGELVSQYSSHIAVKKAERAKGGKGDDVFAQFKDKDEFVFGVRYRF